MNFAQQQLAADLTNVLAAAKPAKARKAPAKATAPKGRKAPAKATPAPATGRKAAKATPVQAARPKAAKLALTDKGIQFSPIPSRSTVRGDANAQAWAAIKAACPADRKTLQDLVPTNRSFVAYAVRQGWLAAL